ncbi:hypothetical protein MJO28_001125 [Puccinia striiformis f. sp. tritici]|uniref:Uncharacterized protein n=1 Tax=Puccinia striiformis f. sp. tritici TaxID=168172 RepID=A0ACC0F0D3_9BASI|nr:hypothetical protein Pst134EA_000117 [Puccinia striiformis f. sp. tritici]KAH9473039.1 hypothetical protein Pst134EA_000117 [Puccinia striiformis f. sp. tritici]KAI7963031.1 hypothetical protein MJO28_001125 [Puccinia striiformis f. sp. tritici]KAI9599879.1 hypothetical protein KEM48_000471 [Puccinia striiformis f. sp. tritici PST-130]
MDQISEIWPPARLGRLYHPSRRATTLTDSESRRTTTTEPEDASPDKTDEAIRLKTHENNVADLDHIDPSCLAVSPHLPRAQQALQELQRIQRLKRQKRLLAASEPDKSNKRRRLAGSEGADHVAAPPKPFVSVFESRTATRLAKSSEPNELDTSSLKSEALAEPAELNKSDVSSSELDPPAESAELDKPDASSSEFEAPAQPAEPNIHDASSTELEAPAESTEPDKLDTSPSEFDALAESTEPDELDTSPSEFDAPAESTELAKSDASSSQAVVLRAGQGLAADKSLHLQPTKHRIRRKFKTKTLTKVSRELPYLRRNWLTPDHHQLTRRACNLRPHRIKIELDTQKVCCGVNQLDVDKLERELSIIQVNFQVFFLPASSQNHVPQYLISQFEFWQPNDQSLRDRFAAQISFSSPAKISLTEHTWIVKITVYHRPCLRSQLLGLINLDPPQKAIVESSDPSPPQKPPEFVVGSINPSSPPKSVLSPSQPPKFFDPNHKSIQRVLQQRRHLNMLFGDNSKKDPGRARVEKNIKSTIRSKLRRVKVPPGIGALHFSTMEPYREGDEVYDSEDDLSHDHHPWRKFRSDQACERTAQVSIIKKCNMAQAKDDNNSNLTPGMHEEIRRLWNLHVRSISVQPSGSASLVLRYADYQRFVELYSIRFCRTDSTRAVLLEFLEALDLDKKNHLCPPRRQCLSTNEKLSIRDQLLYHFDRFDAHTT